MTAMQPVRSSYLREIGYDEETRTLIIGFAGGNTFTYDDVPPETHAAMMGADSIGKFFHANIRKQFAATRMPVPPGAAEPVNVLAAG